MKDYNSVTIGIEMKRKNLIFFWLAFSFFGGYGAVGIYNILRIYFNIPYQVYLSISLLLYLVVVVFLMPIAGGTTETIVFSDEYLTHYQVKGYVNKFKEVIRIILNRQKRPDIRVKTSNIDKINLSYLKYLGGRGLYGYRLKITFLLKDGTSFYLFPITAGQMENGDYEKALLLMESHGIEIVDKMSLRPYLSKNSYAFQEYAASLERGKEL